MQNPLIRAALAKGYISQEKLKKAEKFKAKYQLRAPVLEILLLKGLLKPSIFKKLQQQMPVVAPPEPGPEIETLIEVGELSPEKVRACQQLYQRFHLSAPLYEVLFLRRALSSEMFRDVALAMAPSVSEQSYQKTLYQEVTLPSNQSDKESEELDRLLAKLEAEESESAEDSHENDEEIADPELAAFLDINNTEAIAEAQAQESPIQPHCSQEPAPLVASPTPQKEEWENDEWKNDYWDKSPAPPDRGKSILFLGVAIGVVLIVIISAGVALWLLYQPQPLPQAHKRSTDSSNTANNVAIHEDNKQGLLYCRCGEEHYHNQEYRQAAAKLSKGIKLLPLATKYRFYLYQALCFQSRKEQAQRILDQLTAIDKPEDHYVNWARGEKYLRAALQQKDFKQRRALLDKARLGYSQACENQELKLLALQKRAVVYEQLYQFNDALQDFKAILEQKPKSSAIRIKLARELFRQGEIAEAHRQLEQVLQECPRHPDVYLVWAQFYHRRQLYQKEQEALRHAIEFLEDPVRKNFCQGRLAMLEQNYLQARTCLQKVVQSNPDHLQVHLVLAQLQRQLHNYRAAEKELKRAIAIEPYNPEVYFQCAELYFHLALVNLKEQHEIEGSNYLELTQETLEKAKSCGKTADVCILQAKLYVQQGNELMAFRELAQAARLAPGYPEIYALRSRIRLKNEEFNYELQQDLVNWKKLAPEDSQPYYYLGLLWVALHRYEKSLLNFNHALQLGEEKALLHRARVLYLLKRFAEAREALAAFPVQRYPQLRPTVKRLKNLLKKQQTPANLRHSWKGLVTHWNRLYRQRKYQDAYNIANILIQASKQSKDAELFYQSHNLMSISLFTLGKFQKAAEMFIKTMQKVQQGGLLACRAAICYAKLQKAPQVFQMLQQAAQRGYANPALLDKPVFQGLLSPSQRQQLRAAFLRNNTKH